MRRQDSRALMIATRSIGLDVQAVALLRGVSFLPIAQAIVKRVCVSLVSGPSVEREDPLLQVRGRTTGRWAFFLGPWPVPRILCGLGRLHSRQPDRDEPRAGGHFLGRPRCRFQPEHEDFCQHGRASQVCSAGLSALRLRFKQGGGNSLN
jgi:hypothetical protein